MPVNTEYNAELIERVDLTEDLAVFKIRSLDEAHPEFKSGQYCAIGLKATEERHPSSLPDQKEYKEGQVIKRAYSIASAPKEKDFIELYITMVQEGELTPRLFNMKVGDKLWVASKITGTFTACDISSDKNLILLSTGTGIAPYISMAREFAKEHNPGKIVIVHGVRQEKDFGYRQELQKLQSELDNFYYIEILSRSDDSWTGLTGHIQDIWKSNILQEQCDLSPTPENSHVFLCGNPSMIQEMKDMMQSQGFKENTRTDPGQIHSEKYW